MKLNLKNFFHLFITATLLLSLLGCSGVSEMKKRREAIDKKEMAEQEKILEEVVATLEQLPTADAVGEDLPDIPRPPKSFRTSSDLTKKEGKAYGTVEYVSTGDINEIVSFYEEKLKAAGWTLTRKLDSSLKGLPGALIGYEKEDIRTEVDIEEGKTQKGEKFYFVRIKHFAKI